MLRQMSKSRVLNFNRKLGSGATRKDKEMSGQMDKNNIYKAQNDMVITGY